MARPLKERTVIDGKLYEVGFDAATVATPGELESLEAFGCIDPAKRSRVKFSDADDEAPAGEVTPEAEVDEVVAPVASESKPKRTRTRKPSAK